MNSIHNRIKTSRIESGLSQSDLAKKTGVSQPTVANWESGSHIPRQSAMEKISEALDVDELWLLSGEHSAAESPAFEYLNAPIRHIPIYTWPDNFDDLDMNKPAGYLPGATHNEALFALLSDGTYAEENALLLFDPNFKTPVKGQKYLENSVIGAHLTLFEAHTDTDSLKARLSATVVQH